MGSFKFVSVWTKNRWCLNNFNIQNAKYKIQNTKFKTAKCLNPKSTIRNRTCGVKICVFEEFEQLDLSNQIRHKKWSIKHGIERSDGCNFKLFDFTLFHCLSICIYSYLVLFIWLGGSAPQTPRLVACVGGARVNHYPLPQTIIPLPDGCFFWERWG